ncbi:hypothetical protein D3C71_2165050 [compost metagenome]
MLAFGAIVITKVHASADTISAAVQKIGPWAQPQPRTNKPKSSASSAQPAPRSSRARAGRNAPANTC